MNFFVYMDGHPQATVVLFPCSLVTQGCKEATMGITVCLLLCLVVCFLAPRSVARGGSVVYIVLATVPDHHFGSGSGSKPNRCQIGGPGCQHTRTVNSGTVRCKSPKPSGLGRLSAGRPAGPSVDLYNVLVFAVG